MSRVIVDQGKNTSNAMVNCVKDNSVHKKEIFAWCLYDWANSSYYSIISTFIFATYFTEKVAINPIIGSAAWADANAIAGVLIALCSPILGSIADYQGKCKPWIAGFAMLAILAAFLLWFMLPSPAMMLPMLTIVIVGCVGLEIASVFYNALLITIAPKAYIGRISGWAWGLGYVGGIVSLSLALLIVNDDITWLHLDRQQFAEVRICGPLVALWLFLFMLPLFWFVPDRKATGLRLRQAIKAGLDSLWHLLRTVHSNKQVFIFLLARMIYTDGLNTLFAFAGIYAAGVMHLSIIAVIKFGIVMNLTAGVGAISFAWLDDWIGSKGTILLALILIISFGIGILFTHTQVWFWLCAIGASLGVGPAQAASRSLLVRLSPAAVITELFGLYAFSGKMTAFFGPWTLGVVTLYFNSQRAGMATIFIFLMLGGLLLTVVKSTAAR